MSTPLVNYSGPAKVGIANTANASMTPMMAEGENGQIKLSFQMKRKKRLTASQGYLLSTLDDTTAGIGFTPFDSWKILPTLFPPFLGVTTSVGTGYGAGALVIGTRPHDFYAGAANGCGQSMIWTPDGRLYIPVRTAIVKPPAMRLGNSQALFTSAEISCLTDPGLAMGAGGELIDTSNPHVNATAGTTGILGPNDTGAAAIADPISWTPDYVNGHWTGVYGIGGTPAGFGSYGGAGLPMDAENGWELIPMVKYSPLVVQGRTYHYRLDSVEFAIKARLQGPSHTQLLAYADQWAQGGILGGGTIAAPTKINLVLTGPSAKTVTLNDCVPIFETDGVEFGGTTLNTGEVMFVTRALPGGGPPVVPPVLLTFSA
jgi:hypothetical protein